MQITNILILDDFLDDIENYVKKVDSGQFDDYDTGQEIFRNIQLSDTTVFKELQKLFPFDSPNLDFIRKSPFKQEEPNMIHVDSMMGELTCIFYLNKSHPEDAGTKFYENIESQSILSKVHDFDGKFKESIFVRMKYNRMIIFPSKIYHSRSIYNNFGSDTDSRLVQVLFINQ